MANVKSNNYDTFQTLEDSIFTGSFIVRMFRISSIMRKGPVSLLPPTSEKSPYILMFTHPHFRLIGRKHRNAMSAIQQELLTVRADHDATKAMKDSRPKEFLSRSDIARSSHGSELEGLLDRLDDDISSQIYYTTTFVEQPSVDEEIDIFQEPRHDQYEAGRDLNYDHREHGIRQDAFIQGGDLLSNRPYQNDTFNSPPQKTYEFYHTDQTRQLDEPIDDYARSRTVTNLVPIDHPQSPYLSVHDSLREQTFSAPIVPHTMQHTQPSPEVRLTPKHSSHIQSALWGSLLQHQTATSSYRPFTQEKVYTSERFLPPRPDDRRSTSAVQRPTSSTRPSLISLASSTSSLLFRTQQSPISSEPESPLTPRSRRSMSPVFLPAPISYLNPPSSVRPTDLSESDSDFELESFVAEKAHLLPREETPRSKRSSTVHLPISPAMPIDLSDSDLEVEIESFVSEKDHLLPREESFHPAMISDTNFSLGRSSVAALVASYQSLSRTGPKTTQPSLATLTPDRSSVHLPEPSLAPEPEPHSEHPIVSRRSSHITRSASRPMNPFKQQRLRRQSLAAQMSSHLTANIVSTSSIASSPTPSFPSEPPPPPPNIAPPPAPPPPVIPPPSTAPSSTLDHLPPVTTPPSRTMKSHKDQPPAAPNPVAALINKAVGNKTGPKFLTSESVKEIHRTASPVSVPVPVVTSPPAKSVGNIPPPPPLPPLPPILPPSTVTPPATVAPPPPSKTTESPRAALIKSFGGKNSPKFLVSEPVREGSRTPIAVSSPVPSASVHAPTSSGVNAIPTPPPLPPMPPLLVD